MERRSVLRGLAAGLLVGPVGARAEDGCTWAGPSPEMVTGPFPPSGFREQIGGRANPGAWREVAENDLDLVAVDGADGTPRGQVVILEVQVLTEGCAPVPGATVQLWQADAKGFYNHENEGRVSPDQLDPAFGYWGEGVADDTGTVRVRTVVPGKYPAGASWYRPPHLHWSVVAAGLRPRTTQSYFEGDVLDGIAEIRALNQADLILNHRDAFTAGLEPAALEAVRRRSLAELVVRFAPGDDGIPVGALTLRL